MTINVERLAAVSVIVSHKGGVLVMPDKQNENGNKFERLGWSSTGDMKVVGGKKQHPGGVSETGESLEETALREIREETGLTPSPGSLVPLGVSTLIYHKRLGDQGKHYGVEVFKWTVNERETKELKNIGAVEEAYLQQGELRERDLIVLELYHQVMRGHMLPDNVYGEVVV